MGGKPINLELKEDFTRKIQAALNKKIKGISYRNEHIFQSLMNMCYLFSLNPTHNVAAEIYTSEGKRLDGLFLPTDTRSTTAIIHEYKYDPEKTNEDLYQEALWQIYEMNYMEIPVKKSKSPFEKYLT